MTAGGLDLRRFLDEHHLSVPSFCEQHEFDRIQIQRLLNGERGRVSTEIAEKIQIATRGAVAWMRWHQYLGAEPPKGWDAPVAAASDSAAE